PPSSSIFKSRTRSTACTTSVGFCPTGTSFFSWKLMGSPSRRSRASMAPSISGAADGGDGWGAVGRELAGEPLLLEASHEGGEALALGSIGEDELDAHAAHGRGRHPRDPGAHLDRPELSARRQDEQAGLLADGEWIRRADEESVLRDIV